MPLACSRFTGALVIGFAGFVVAACGLWSSEPDAPYTIELGLTEFEAVPGVSFGPGPGAQPSRYVDFVVRRNGYAGPITYSVELRSPGHGAQPPSAAIISSNYPEPPDSVASVVVAYPSGTSPGTYVFRLHAASEAGTATADITVRVVSFTLRVPPSLTVARGRMNTLGLTFARDPEADIAVTASMPAAGVSMTSTAPIGGRGYVDIVPAEAAQIGTFVLTVTATSGAHSVSKTVDVTVIPAPATRPVAFRWCRARTTFTPTRTYAFANEGSAWTAVTPDADNVIRLDATERLSFAEFFWLPGTYAAGTVSRVVYLTAEELESMQCPDHATDGSTHPVVATNALDYFAALGPWRVSNGMQISAGKASTADLIASGTFGGPNGAVSRAIVRRNQTLASGDTIRLDFGSPEALQLQENSLLTTDLSLVTPNVYVFTASTISRLSGSVNASTTLYRALPESALLDGEVQALMASRDDRGVMRWFRAPPPVTLSFGPTLAEPVVDTDAQTVTLPAQSEYPDFAGIAQRVTLDGRGVYDQVEVWQSRSYMGSTPGSWTFRLPDLGRIRAVSPFHHGDIAAVAVNGPGALLFGGAGAPGAELRWASRHPATFLAFPFPVGY